MKASRKKRSWQKLTCDGRLTFPKINLQILQEGEIKDLTGAVLDVTIRPANGPGVVEGEVAASESGKAAVLEKVKAILRSLGNNVPEVYLWLVYVYFAWIIFSCLE